MMLVNRMLFANLIIFLVSSLTCADVQTTPTLSIELQKVVETGRENLMFQGIASVCEDDGGNFFVLDYKAHKVHKFTPDGKLVLSFGQKGRGPGDLLWPHYIGLTEEKRIAVCQVRDSISLFSPMGEFLEKIKVPIGLGLVYINKNLFYAWVWRDKTKQQVFIDGQGNIIKSFFAVSRDSFSVSTPDETGRLVMSNHIAGEYTPGFLFNRSGNNIVIGISNRYEILSINQKGQTTKVFKRNIKPRKIKPIETAYFKDQINNRNKLHDFAKKKFIKMIPKVKNYFDKILISNRYVFVFRIKENVNRESSKIPVDVFDRLKGHFMGSIEFKNHPILVTGHHIYFVETPDEELLLTKYRYNLK